MPRQLGRASKQGEAVMDGTSSVAVPDKARGHIGSALNAFVLRCQAINLYNVGTFHLLYATVATPLPYKKEARGVLWGDSDFLDWARIVASPRTEEHKINTDKQD